MAYSYGTATTKMSTELNSLANTSGATTSTAIDNSTDKAIGAKLTCYFTGIASATGNADVYIIESTDGTNFGTTETANMRYVGSVDMNETTQVVKTLDVGNLPPKFHIRVINNSGAAFAASGSYIDYLSVDFA